MPKKKLQLKTVQALIEVTLNDLTVKPVLKGKNYLPEKVYLHLLREEVKDIVTDYRLMRKTLKKEGYEIKTTWDKSLTGKVVKDEPGKKTLKRRTRKTIKRKSRKPLKKRPQINKRRKTLKL